MTDHYNIKKTILFTITIAAFWVVLALTRNIVCLGIVVFITFWLIERLEIPHERYLAKVEGRAYEP